MSSYLRMAYTITSTTNIIKERKKAEIILWNNNSSGLSIVERVEFLVKVSGCHHLSILLHDHLTCYYDYVRASWVRQDNCLRILNYLFLRADVFRSTDNIFFKLNPILEHKMLIMSYFSFVFFLSQLFNEVECRRHNQPDCRACTDNIH